MLVDSLQTLEQKHGAGCFEHSPFTVPICSKGAARLIMMIEEVRHIMEVTACVPSLS